MSDSRINDAEKAQAAAKRYLAAQFGADRIKSTTYSKSWYTQGSMRDLWEVEGDVILKKGRFGKETIRFKLQVDPSTGSVITFDRTHTPIERTPGLLITGFGGGILGIVIGAIGLWATNSINVLNFVYEDLLLLGNYVILPPAICGAVSALTTQYVSAKMKQDVTTSLILGTIAGTITTAVTANTIASAMVVSASEVVIPVTLIGLGVSFLVSSGVYASLVLSLFNTHELNL